MKRAKKGQSILEYLIIVAVIVAAIAAIAITFQGNVKSAIDTAGNKIGAVSLDR
jgi:Flp pilus assembly pilin Flp